MKTPDLVFRGRRVSSDHALVLANVELLPSVSANGVAARETIRRAAGDGADLVVLTAARGDAGDAEIERLVPLVEWAGETFPELVLGVGTRRAEVARAACSAGAHLIDAHGSFFEVAVEFGAGYVGSDVSEALAAGVPRAGLVLDGGIVGTAGSMPEADGWPVALGVAGDGTPAGLALVALVASAGVTIVRTAHVRQTRHAVEMAASIAGTRPPAKAVRWE